MSLANQTTAKDVTSVWWCACNNIHKVNRS